MNAIDDLMKGSVDIHVHFSPDPRVERRSSAIEIVEQDVHAPEIFNSTLSSKKIFDTFGIKQKSWHGDLKEVIKSLYEGVYRVSQSPAENESTKSDVA